MSKSSENISEPVSMSVFEQSVETKIARSLKTELAAPSPLDRILVPKVLTIDNQS